MLGLRVMGSTSRPSVDSRITKGTFQPYFLDAFKKNFFIWMLRRRVYNNLTIFEADGS
jgi:hypothetical protein